MTGLQQLMTTLNPLKVAGMEAYAKELLESIGSGLSDTDQVWLTKNLGGLPDYLRSKEGAQVMTLVVACYRASRKKVDWNN